MFHPVVHHNSDRPNSNESSSDISPDEDNVNMERNWEHGLVFIFLLYTLLYTGKATATTNTALKCKHTSDGLPSILVQKISIKLLAIFSNTC